MLVPTGDWGGTLPFEFDESLPRNTNIFKDLSRQMGEIGNIDADPR